MPIDEMILELKFALERLQDNPTCTNFDLVLEETRRIEAVAEDLIIKYVDTEDHAV